ncbi:MAG: hypothetical protein C0615_09715 [Desulfuromonas sp.]|nr:MAG: hypothetical protein C0615_09715 [Desulfuromonas sp.]
MSEKLDKGKAMLEEVALGYAKGHGLTPAVEWEDLGFEWMLRLSDDDHTVRVGFSPDEIEFFAEDLPENKETKMKIRNAFASLSM